MKKILALSIITVLLISAGSTFSNAAVIDMGDMYKDEATGNVWMDLGEFYDQTVAQVQASISGTGFRLATKSEVELLQASMPLSGGLTAWEQYAAILGVDAPPRDNGWKIIWGMYDIGLADTMGSSFAWHFDTGDWRHGSQASHYAAQDYGAWVVNTDYDGGTVPEPTTLFLFGSGLVGLAFRKRSA